MTSQQLSSHEMLNTNNLQDFSIINKNHKEFVENIYYVDPVIPVENMWRNSIKSKNSVVYKLNKEI